LKIQGLANTGGQAKVMIQDGMVAVNGDTETRRGRKLRSGDVVAVVGSEQAVQVQFD
jgi:ribosome-associated protein